MKIDTATGTYTPVRENYYHLGQVSKFVVPGAYHIASTGSETSLNHVAFQNPDGSDVLVVHNITNPKTSVTFDVRWHGQYFSYNLQAGDIATFTWTPASIGVVNSYKSQDSGRCLDDPFGTSTNGTQMQIYDCGGGTPQKFTYTTAHQLQIAGKCLGADNNGTTNGTKVILWDCNGTSSQQWNLNGDGSITGAGSGLCMDVVGGPVHSGNGTLVQLYRCAGLANQKWTRI